MEPVTEPAPPRPSGSGGSAGPDVDFEEDGELVDLFDAAARIEAQGYSDRTVSARFGFDSVFDLAGDVLVRRRPRQHRVEKAAGSPALSVTRAWMRASLLVSGAVLAGLVQVQLGTRPLEMIVAGCAGWILGQAVAGITWYRLRLDALERAVHYGGLVAAVCAGVALAGSLALLVAGLLSPTGLFLVLGWVVYALSVSLLTVMDRVLLPLTVMAGTVFVQLLVWAAVPQDVGALAGLTVLPAVAGVAVIVVHTVRCVRFEKVPDSLGAPELRGILVPVMQAVLLAGALVIALSGVPDSHGTAFVATAVLAVALTDPGIVALRVRLSWFAHRSTSLLWSRWFAWALASLSVLAVAAVAAALVVVIVAVTGSQQEELPGTVLGAVLFSVLATLSSVLTAFGAQGKGLVPAALAVVVMLVVGGLTGGVVVLVGVLGCTAGLLLLIHQFSDARVFA